MSRLAQRRRTILSCSLCCFVRDDNRGILVTPKAVVPLFSLSNEEIVRVTDELLQNGELDNQSSKTLDKLASTIPAIAESVERLCREARDVSFIALIYKEPSEH